MSTTDRRERLDLRPDHVCRHCLRLLGGLGQEFIDQKAGKDSVSASVKQAKHLNKHPPRYVVDLDCVLCEFILQIVRRSHDEKTISGGFSTYVLQGLRFLLNNAPKTRQIGKLDVGWLKWFHGDGVIKVHNDDGHELPEKHLSTDALVELHRQTPLVDFASLQRKIQECQKTHSLCQQAFEQAQGPLYPIKLIHCLTRQVVVADADAVYLTLSYVWGRGPQSDSDHSLSDGQLPKNILPLIEDALETTKKLGFEYLWVDRYCINQSDKEEVKAQVSQMDLIYGGAAFCIIPVCAESPSSRMPGIVQPRSILQELHLRLMTFTLTPARTGSEIQTSLWNTRGWTYQEIVLSRRRLYIGKDQIYWNCLSDWYSDKYPNHTNRKLPFELFPTLQRVELRLTSFQGETDSEPEADQDDAEYSEAGSQQPDRSEDENGSTIFMDTHFTLIDHLWMHIGQFNKRQFTNSADALPATKGMFNALQRFAVMPALENEVKQTFQTFYGLPICYGDISSRETEDIEMDFLQRLVENLSWKVYNEYSNDVPCGDKRLGNPSWSWASRVGRTSRPIEDFQGVHKTPRKTVAGTSVKVRATMGKSTIQTEKLDWGQFCRQRLDFHAEDARFNPLAELDPVLIVHGLFFPIVEHNDGIEGKDKVDFCIVPPDARDDQTQFASKMCIDFGLQRVAGPHALKPSSIRGTLFAIPCLFYEGFEVRFSGRADSLAWLIVEGIDSTLSECSFERIGCFWKRYKNALPPSELFKNLCERYPEYEKLSQGGLHLI